MFEFYLLKNYTFFKVLKILRFRVLYLMGLSSASPYFTSLSRLVGLREILSFSAYSTSLSRRVDLWEILSSSASSTSLSRRVDLWVILSSSSSFTSLSRWVDLWILWTSSSSTTLQTGPVDIWDNKTTSASPLHSVSSSPFVWRSSIPLDWFLFLKRCIYLVPTFIEFSLMGLMLLFFKRYLAFITTYIFSTVFAWYILLKWSWRENWVSLAIIFHLYY